MLAANTHIDPTTVRYFNSSLALNLVLHETPNALLVPPLPHTLASLTSLATPPYLPPPRPHLSVPPRFTSPHLPQAAVHFSDDFKLTALSLSASEVTPDPDPNPTPTPTLPLTPTPAPAPNPNPNPNPNPDPNPNPLP